MENKFDKLNIPELIHKIRISRFWSLPEMLDSVLRRIQSGGSSMWDLDDGYLKPKNSAGVISNGNPGSITNNLNTAIGQGTLTSITTGNQNTSIGSFSGEFITSGAYNTTLGVNSGSYITTGQQNTALGVSSLGNNTSGSYNTAVGTSALLSSTGDQNTAVGTSSGYNVTTGNQNTSIGYLSLQGRVTPVTGNFNIAVGFQALRGVTTGGRNIEIGAPTSDNITSGSNNININTSTGITLGAGSNNLVLGNIGSAQSGITSGTNENIAIGVNNKIRWRVTPEGNHGINTNLPNQSAVFQIEATNKGFLPPRLTTEQKNGIVLPAEGLMLYDTTLKVLCYYNGTEWIPIL